MRTALLLALALLAGSCSDRLRLNASDAYDLADAAQANARTALSQNEDQESEISDHERQVRSLELRVSSLEDVTSDNARIANARWDAYQRHTH